MLWSNIILIKGAVIFQLLVILGAHFFNFDQISRILFANELEYEDPNPPPSLSPGPPKNTSFWIFSSKSIFPWGGYLFQGKRS